MRNQLQHLADNALKTKFDWFANGQGGTWQNFSRNLAACIENTGWGDMASARANLASAHQLLLGLQQSAGNGGTQAHRRESERLKPVARSFELWCESGTS